MSPDMHFPEQYVTIPRSPVNMTPNEMYDPNTKNLY